MFQKFLLGLVIMMCWKLSDHRIDKIPNSITILNDFKQEI